MAYEVLARKWRPRQFADVVGQDHVTRTLCNAIESGRLAHAYLFVGPRGIGKTSIARIFASALNCVNGPTVTPCGQCDACREIAAGTNLDVLEIDGASNNGVDQVRDLRDTVRFAPTSGKYKIYIIDEVHMLSTAAFNALLKTLEEPPPYVKFIFATTEPQRVLATVLSRCQRFDLRRIAVPEIVERLRTMAAAEKVKADADALLAIARGAEGGMRDAQSALDQLISFVGDSITEADVLSVFGLVARAKLESLADGILGGDIKAILGLVGELDRAGKDLARLVVELMEHFRNVLVCLNVDAPAAELDLTDAQIAAVQAQAARTDTARVLRIVAVLGEAEDRMKFALSRRTLLETALIRSARAATVVSLEEILQRLQALREGVREEDASPVAGRTTLPPEPPAPAAPVERASAGAGAEKQAREPSAPPYRAHRAHRAPRGPRHMDGRACEEELHELMRDWPELIAKVAKKAVQTKAALVDSRPVSVDADRVVIGFDREFPEEKRRLEGGRERKALEQTLSTFLERAVHVEFALVNGDLDRKPDQPPDGRESPKAKPTRPPGARALKEWAEEDTVRKALELFNGTIIDVRE